MKSVNELITVGMPVFNGEKYLSKAIISILEQTYTNFELIISDDASTDNSRTIYQKFLTHDKRIRLFKHKKNIGSIANFNFVLKKARGKFFMWAAQDDIRDKNALLELMNLFKSYPDAVLAASNYKNVYGNKTYFVYPQVAIDNKQNIVESIVYFLKTDNLSLFYGLHKTDNLKKAGGYWVDSRPFFKSSDFLTIFNVLLKGKFIYSQKVLFLKRDTGYYTKQYEVIEKMEYKKDVLKKIFRFIISPVYYLYDFIYGSMLILKSEHVPVNKFRIELYLATNTIKKCANYIIICFKGIIAFIKGLRTIYKI